MKIHPKFCDIYYLKLRGNRYSKYCVCVDPVRRLFMYINTDQSRRFPSGDVFIEAKGGLNFLTHDSFINTSHIIRIFDYRIQDREPIVPIGCLPKFTIQRFIPIVYTNKEITQRLKKIIWNQLDEVLKEELKEYKPTSLEIPNYGKKTKAS